MMQSFLNAPFICATEERNRLYAHVNAPCLRKNFSVPEFQTAELYICGLGFYKLYLNGKEITKGKLAPYISNPNDLVYYDRYDLSELLRVGRNAIGIILGNGFQNNVGGHPWGFDRAPWVSSPKLSLTLLVDGRVVLSTAESFRCAPSAICFDDLRCGEYCDARLEQSGWTTPDFDDSNWSDSIPAALPKGERVICRAEPIKCEKEILPVAKWECDNALMFDFGVNSAGVCRIKHKGFPGQKLTIWHCEALLEGRTFYNKNTCTPDFDRSLSQKDIFVCSGNEDVFEPSFTYHGFRYVMVEGVGLRQISDDFITMCVLHSDIPAAGRFSCSDDTLNRLQEVCCNTIKSNFFYFPTDCPQREKNGWTGDAALGAEQQLWNLDCANSLAVWLDNIRKAQDESGKLPAVVPTDEFGWAQYNGPGWDRIIIELPWQIYRFNGDLQALRENADAIWRYIGYMLTKTNDNGLFSYGLVDWLEPGKLFEVEASTPLEVTDTLICLDMLEKASFIFEQLNEPKKAEFCRERRMHFLNLFRKIHVCGTELRCRTQTAQAMAIAYHVFGEDEIATAVHVLVDLIARDNHHLKTGMLGMRVLFPVLSENGYSDLAYRLITQPSPPSYRYWLDHGATALWESFNEVYDNSILRIDGGRTMSLNHPCWAFISSWFFEYILGLKINPDGDDSCNFEISPCQLQKITSAEGSFQSKQGSISVKWHRNEKGIPEINVSTSGNFRYRLRK